MSDFAESDHLEELDDLEPLEVEDLSAAGELPSPLEDLADPDILSLLKRFEYSAIPFLLLGKDLKILRCNEVFLQRFSLTKEEIDSKHLLALFSVPDEENRRNLPRDIDTPEKHFCWKGYGELIRREHKTEKTNLLIGPAESAETKEPRIYFCLFDIITRQINELVMSTFKSLLDASLLKDNDTGNHIRRVGEYAKIMAEHLYDDPKYPEITFDFIEDIAFLAAMHDVGKIGTPDDILNKEGPLNQWEWDIMKEHTINGAYILNTYPNPMARDIALYHHERWDGTGYPYAILGEQIPLAAKITTIADVYDALRMKRSYKPPFSHEKAISIIRQDSGSHFDPDLVKLLEHLESQFEEIFSLLKDEDENPHKKTGRPFGPPDPSNH